MMRATRSLLLILILSFTLACSAKKGGSANSGGGAPGGAPAVQNALPPPPGMLPPPAPIDPRVLQFAQSVAGAIACQGGVHDPHCIQQSRAAGYFRESKEFLEE